MEIERELAGLGDTAKLGSELAAVLRAGDVVLLDGPLGAGKTTLVRSIVESFGGDAVSSPTFVVVNEYETEPVVMHVDAYRLDGGDDEELALLGWDRVVSDETVALIEWGERIADLIEGEAATIGLEHAGETERRVTIRLPESWGERAGIGVLLGRTETTCRVTGVRVSPDNPHWPFADERAKLADLHRWFSENYTISRPMTEADLEQGE